MRAPYYIGDLKRDPGLENYPKQLSFAKARGSQVRFTVEQGTKGCLDGSLNPKP